MDNKTQYDEILEVFREIIENIDDDTDVWEVIDVLSYMRARYLFSIVADNLFLSYEYAIDIVEENIDKHKDDIKDNEALVLVSAIKNLIDFSVSQQYQMMTEMPSEMSMDNWDEMEDTFETYNKLYASVENDIVDQSAKVALAWMYFDEESIITYNTQRDERVRDSHALLDGLMYKKKDFPEHLHPPIDWGCRCFLVSSGHPSMQSMLQAKTVGDIYFNPIFSESLATGGKIFGDEHSYFDISEEHIDKIQSIKKDILKRMING